MAGIRFGRLVENFVATLERSSSTVIRERTTYVDRPARFRVVTSDGATDCIVFLWTITPGGGGPGVRPENERRIQLTRLGGIPLEPGRRTLLGGWSDEFGVYCFWDPRRHTVFSSKSPSLQVTTRALEQAANRGIATYLRPSLQGQEVVVSVHPDSLLWYVQHGLPIHNAEEDANSVVSLSCASPEEERTFLDESKGEIQTARRYDLVETMRAYREANFRPLILRAYSYRCCVCQYSLKLVDAAHIIPVSYPGSTDDVDNGLALCRLHHGAYDNGLIGIRSDYRIIVNPTNEARLSELQLDTGLTDFKARLPEAITVPASIEARPGKDKLLVGLRARRWPESLVR